MWEQECKKLLLIKISNIIKDATPILFNTHCSSVNRCNANSLIFALYAYITHNFSFSIINHREILLLPCKKLHISLPLSTPLYVITIRYYP
ncbi:hypothetical protein Mpsy_1470 [Methanolobus psychrophilus R15]|nr:hypothetical protein Mpsy_1470 [Methanolobus psychrophilus R15]